MFCKLFGLLCCILGVLCEICVVYFWFVWWVWFFVVVLVMGFYLFVLGIFELDYLIKICFCWFYLVSWNFCFFFFFILEELWSMLVLLIILLLFLFEEMVVVLNELFLMCVWVDLFLNLFKSVLYNLVFLY